MLRGLRDNGKGTMAKELCVCLFCATLAGSFVQVTQAEVRIYGCTMMYQNDQMTLIEHISWCCKHHNVFRPYVAMHKTKLKSESPKKEEALLVKEHNAKFAK